MVDDGPEGPGWLGCANDGGHAVIAPRPEAFDAVIHKNAERLATGNSHSFGGALDDFHADLAICITGAACAVKLAYLKLVHAALRFLCCDGSIMHLLSEKK